MYGTAWKEGETARLTALAIEAGFRAIDTANQRRHYHEVGVGETLRKAIGDGRVGREDLFLQTKFTSVDGQDHRLPYDPRAPIATQVEQSFASSLEHLGVVHLDSYVLHGPAQSDGLTDEDWQIWRAMEGLHTRGKTRHLGVSNVSAAQLESLCAAATVEPTFVQNRCYASRGWDRAVREVCGRRGLRYQGFSLLTANRPLLQTTFVRTLAQRVGATVPQVIFRFAQRMGMLPLTGTTSSQHMDEDLAASAIALSDEDVAVLERVSDRG
jgi:diketogulonate reductase-like aldo/keto reductase